jgi:hypothetical protein
MGEDTEKRVMELAGKLNVKFMVRKELKKLPSMLHEREEVVNLSQGRYEGKEGLIAVTDRRVLFVDEGIVTSHREDFPYERISSVQSSTKMLSGRITIFASGNKAEIDNIMPKQQAESIAEYVRMRISPGQREEATQPPEPVPASEPDVYDKLKKLGELRDTGVLTQDEFDQKKAELLSQL